LVLRRRLAVTRLALISDIHGNGVAFDAVLADIDVEAVDEIVCLGDVAAGGPQPRQVLARLRQRECRVVRGNADDWLLSGFPAGRSAETRRLGEVVTWARAQLQAGDLDYLDGFPPTLSLSVGAMTICCFHGSPHSNLERLLATTPEGTLDEFVDAAPGAGLFVGGHTHLMLLRRHRDKVFVNPGSVGLPLGAMTLPSDGVAALPAWSEYAIVEENNGVATIAFRSIPVDLHALAAAAKHMPHASWAVDLAVRITRWNARQPGG
jgi:putative phosphoesterase